MNFNLTEEVLNSEEKIETWTESGKETKIWIDLPPSTVTFGSEMSNPAVYAKCQQFILSVSRLHKSGIVNGFQEMTEIMENDFRRSLNCIKELTDITNDNSRWGVAWFFANTSNKPVIIQQHGTLIIYDKNTETEFKEECYLSQVDYKHQSAVDAQSPVIIKGEESRNFVFFTKDVQKDMKLGTAIRECFKREESTCYLIINIHKTGLISNQICKSKKADFIHKLITISE